MMNLHRIGWAALLMSALSLLALAADGGDPLLTKSAVKPLVDQKAASFERKLSALESEFSVLEGRVQELPETPPEEPVIQNPFRDVDGHWAAPYIAYLYSQRITSGFPDGTFHPDDPLTREQVVVLLGRARGWAPLEDTSPFADVAVDRWSAPWIARAKEEGFVGGYPDGTFQPGSPVTRGELAALVVRAFALDEGAKKGTAIDLKEHWAASPARIILSLGLDQVDGTQRFRPEDPSTRGEVSAYLARAMKPAYRL